MADNYQRKEYMDSPFQGLLNMFYNVNRDRAKNNYLASAEDVQNFLNEFAEDYPSLEKVMQEEGLLNPDGTVNTDKYVDRNYLDKVLQCAMETEAGTMTTALQNARLQSALAGTPSSTAQTANLARIANETARELNRDYADTVQTERERARSEAYDWGQQHQSDRIGEADARLNALENQLSTDEMRLNSEQQGLLQDPNAMANLIGMGIGLATGNPALATLNLFSGNDEENSTPSMMDDDVADAMQQVYRQRALGINTKTWDDYKAQNPNATWEQYQKYINRSVSS